MSRRVALICLSLAWGLGGCSCEFFESGDLDAGPMAVGGVGARCASGSECREGLLCTDEGLCAPAGTSAEGASCALTGECADGLYCDAVRRCAPAGDAAEGEACASVADCQAGLSCALLGFGFECQPSGDGDLGYRCDQDRDCLAGLSCLDGVDGARCQSPPVLERDGGMAPPPPRLPPWSGVSCEADEGPPRIYFEVPRFDETDADFYRLPFPNDVRRTDAGLDLRGHPTPGTALDIDVLGRHLDAASQDLDGFATNPVVYFRFSEGFRFESATASRIWLVDITPDSPDFGRNLARGWFSTSGQITRYICPNWLSIRRGHGAPLRPGTTYAAFLTDGIETAETGNGVFGRDDDFEAVIGAERPADEALARAWDAYAPLRDWLASSDSPAASTVINAAVFTTQSADLAPQRLRQAVRAADAPTLSDLTLCDEGVESPCDDGGARRCVAADPRFHELHARLTLPQFQQGTPPFLEPEDGGGMSLDGSGVPVVQRQEPVCVVITVPRDTAAPPEGFPTVVYAHGTGGAATAAARNGLAADFATDPGAVTVTLDLPLHGSRRGESTEEPDTLVFNFANPRAARDNFLQGAADLMGVIRWLEEATVPAADLPTDVDLTFDPARITLFAHSQGATHAQLFAPYEPSLLALVLSGAGGDLTESLLTKTRPVNIARVLPLALLDIAPDGTLVTGDRHPALAIFQMFHERVDPVNFGRALHPEPALDRLPHTFMTYGPGDSFSTERTMMAFARAANLPHVGPELVDVGVADPVPPPVAGNVTVADAPYTVGLRQYAPDDGDDGHFVSTRTTDGRADVLRFLRMALSGETPAIGE